MYKCTLEQDISSISSFHMLIEIPAKNSIFIFIYRRTNKFSHLTHIFSIFIRFGNRTNTFHYLIIASHFGISQKPLYVNIDFVLKWLQLFFFFDFRANGNKSIPKSMFALDDSIYRFHREFNGLVNDIYPKEFSIYDVHSVSMFIVYIHTIV